MTNAAFLILWSRDTWGGTWEARRDTDEFAGKERGMKAKPLRKKFHREKQGNISVHLYVVCEIGSRGFVSG